MLEMLQDTNYDVVTYTVEDKETGKNIYKRIQIFVGKDNSHFTYHQRIGGFWKQIPFIEPEIQNFVLQREENLIASIRNEGEFAARRDEFIEELKGFFETPEIKKLGAAVRI